MCDKLLYKILINGTIFIEPFRLVLKIYIKFYLRCMSVIIINNYHTNDQYCFRLAFAFRFLATFQLIALHRCTLTPDRSDRCRYYVSAEGLAVVMGNWKIIVPFSSVDRPLEIRGNERGESMIS